MEQDQLVGLTLKELGVVTAFAAGAALFAFTWGMFERKQVNPTIAAVFAFATVFVVGVLLVIQ